MKNSLIKIIFDEKFFDKTSFSGESHLKKKEEAIFDERMICEKAAHLNSLPLLKQRESSLLFY